MEPLVIRRLAVTALLAVATIACGGVENSDHADGLRAIVASSPPEWVGEDELGQELWEYEQRFYEERGHLPAWVDGDRTTPHMKDLLQQLRYAEQHGLDPAAYGVEGFERMRDESQTRFRGTRFDPAVVPELDVRMTYAYLRYAADLLGWTGDPADVSRTWVTSRNEDDLAARLGRAIDEDAVPATLEELAPSHPQYEGLQVALARAREQRSGDVDRIVMNLERWRWVPRDLGDRYVLVNVPAYMLQVMEGRDPVLAMRVIVGEPSTPTPLFSDQMTYIVFSPYWNIPESILREETLPRMASDPAFLTRNNIEVVGTSGEGAVDPASIDWTDESATSGLRFRQRPGPHNALGLVKFIFPNNFSVYLHDTPGDRLFGRDARAFSHGCIRVEEPVELAKYVLSDQPEWTEGRITDAMSSRQERTVMLNDPIPVHIGYWTAWIQPDGSVTFTDDPYGIDEAHDRARAERAPNATPATSAD